MPEHPGAVLLSGSFLSTMKINQLPYGARFEYEGEEYVKSGPMFGTGKDGPRLIPKYAMLKPLADGEAVSRKSGDLVSRADVLDAFAVFFAECKSRVPEDRLAEIDAARDRFLKVFR